MSSIKNGQRLQNLFTGAVVVGAEIKNLSNQIISYLDQIIRLAGESKTVSSCAPDATSSESQVIRMDGRKLSAKKKVKTTSKTSEITPTKKREKQILKKSKGTSPKLKKTLKMVSAMCRKGSHHDCKSIYCQCENCHHASTNL